VLQRFDVVRVQLERLSRQLDACRDVAGCVPRPCLFEQVPGIAGARVAQRRPSIS
jgi:hypothetical protein